MHTWSRFCSSKLGGAELVRAGICIQEQEHDQLLTLKFHKICNVPDINQLLSKKLTAIPLTKPGAMDPNWKGNALDASPGTEINKVLIVLI